MLQLRKGYNDIVHEEVWTALTARSRFPLRQTRVPAVCICSPPAYCCFFVFVHDLFYYFKEMRVKPIKGIFLS